MAYLVGVEPATFWSVVRRSIQLSYGCILKCIYNLKKNGGEGGIWTLDPSFSPDTPLAGERIRPLCHFSTYIKLNGGWTGIRTLRAFALPVFKTGPLAVRTFTHTYSITISYFSIFCQHFFYFSDFFMINICFFLYLHILFSFLVFSFHFKL